MHGDAEELRERFLRASSPDAFVAALADLATLVRARELNRDDAAKLAAEVLADAATLDGWEQDGVLVRATGIVGALYCELTQPEDSSGLSRGSELRRSLGRWVSTLPGDLPEQVAQQLNKAMLSDAGGELSRARLYMIRWAGFRSSEVERTLLGRGARDDDIGRIALHSLALLGPGEEVRKDLVGLLVDRARARLEREVAGGLAVLGSADALLSVLEPVADRPQSEAALRRRAVAMAAAIARRNPHRRKLQRQVLAYLVALVEQDSAFLRELAVRGDWLANINSEKVVPHTLAWANDPELPDHTRHLLLLRLEDMRSPLQLEGWRDCTVGQPLVEWATRDTGTESLWVEREWQRKEAAWNALISGRGASALPQAVESIDNERNSYLYRQLASRLAVFELPAVPDSAAKVVAGDYDHPEGGQGNEYARRIGALRLIRSSPALEAFKLLSGWRFTYQGHVLTEVVRAFSEVAMAAEREAPHIVRDTLDQMSTGEGWQRVAAADARLALEPNDVGPAELLKRASSALDDDRDATEIALLIMGLHQLPPNANVPDQLLAALKEWTASDNELLAQRAALALAGTGALRLDKELLRKLAGLEHDGSTYRWTGARPTPPHAGLLVQVMGAREPRAFGDVIISLVESSSWEIAVALVPSFGSVAQTGEEMRDRLVAAVRERALRQSASSTETDWFAALAHLSVKDFLAVDWRAAASDWMPAALIALGDALRGCPTPDSPELRRKVRDHLQFLTESPDFGVRRAGYRAAVDATPVFATQLFTSWAAAKSAQLRVRAAESMEWLPAGEGDAVLLHLSTARARRVRDVARRVTEDRSRRRNFERVLQRVVAIDGSNDSVCSVWAHVEALREEGDDTVAERLRSATASATWPVRVKRWLDDVAGDIEKRWKGANKDWPAPWHRWDGAVEELDAHVSSEDGYFPVRVFLWRAPADYGLQEWGGAVVEDEQNAIPLFGMKVFTIELSDGRTARAVRQRYATGTVSFRGLGPYPRDGASNGD
ncbi:MAG: hypothetical protein JJ863_17570 [Deltaproteobacteria bacterium]|nr:hypothetical protein [Deltaproteobacteria bacterium]